MQGQELLLLFHSGGDWQEPEWIAVVGSTPC